MKRMTKNNGRLIACWSGIAICLFLTTISLHAQSAKKTEYGASMTIAWYQFDDVRSKKADAKAEDKEGEGAKGVTILRQTASSAEDEIDYMTRHHGIEDLKNRHVRTVGLAEGESFSDALGMNDKPLMVTIRLLQATQAGARFEIVARYDGKVLLEQSDVRVGNYETVMIRGGSGEFGVKEFAGPKGVEMVPQRRALLLTVTPTVIAVRGLRNRPSEISRATNEFGVPLKLSPEDVFVMPAPVTRVALKFSGSSAPRGAIILEAVITPEGRVSNIKVLDSPDSAYNARAADTYRQFRFTPATLNGKPIHATWRETFVLSPPEVP